MGLPMPIVPEFLIYTPNISVQGEQSVTMPKNNDPKTESQHISPYPSGFRLLTDAQLEEVHLASLEILRRTGVRVHEEEALALLGEAGCIITDGNLVRFPAAVVEDALQKAPSRVVLCDRTGESRVLLEGHRVYFGTGSDLPNTRDLDTGERRLSLLSDVEKTARLADGLPNLDFVMSMALPSDVPIETSDRRSFLAMIQNTVKPVVFTAWDEVGLSDIIAMAEAVAGGPEELTLKPFLFAYLEPTSPLQHSREAVRKLLMMADHRLPFVYAPGPVEGASAPVTSAGSLAMANAEVMSGLVIAQLRRPGTPFVWGSGSGPLDMRTMAGTYSAPEFMLHCMAMAELAHRFYNLPVWGFSGCSDSKLPDIQAGIESALWMLWTALSGANLVHDVGYIESGLTCSYEMMVMGDEIISFVRRLMGGIPFTPETLALDLIHEVGPGGDYLGTQHTARHFRDDWYPRILDRRGYHGWVEAGRPTAIENARDVACEILDTHQPLPIQHDTLEALHTIIREADARAGIELG
jgi:trimethylamine--corrinoid protein Co-methyltransferase